MQAMPDRRHHSRLVARLAVLAALLGTTGALAFLVLQRPDRDASASKGLTAAQMTTLAQRAEALARELERLDPERSARPAQQAVREALAVQKTLADAAAGSGDRIRTALEREAEYLDAVGSVLSNRLSPLRPELASRASRVRAAFRAVPGGKSVAEATRGTRELLAFSEARGRD